jgi:IclR family KDG regulon transcriptional repressor
MLDSKKEQSQLHTVERALRVLSIFDEENSELSLHEVSSLLAMPKSMVFRTLHTLEAMGYVIKNDKTKSYTLGFEVFRLGKIFERNLQIKKVAMSFMQELNIATKETVVLVVPDLRLNRAVCIQTLESHHTIKYSPEMGTVGYFHSGAPRKAIFAHLESEMIDYIIHHVGLPKISKNTMTSPTELISHLAVIKETGIAISREEVIPEVYSIAAPLFNSVSNVVGSVAINMPIYRVTEEKEQQLIRMIKLYGSRISDKLGYKQN